MKKIGFFGFILLLLFGSCSTDLEQTDGIEGRDIMDARLKIVVVDQTLQDRLNPESSGYFGEAYTKGIELLYLCNGKKLTLLETWPYLANGNALFPEDYKLISPPSRETADYGTIDLNTMGYYFLNADPEPVLAENDLTYSYIQYPDGSEDEIKIQIFRNKKETLLCIGKIWFNGELIYAMSENRALYYLDMLSDSVDTSDPDNFLDYYNPKYYPWLEPVVDDAGNQIGNHVRPQNGSDIVVIIK